MINQTTPNKNYQNSQIGVRFSLNITDLSRIDNPSLSLHDRTISESGFLDVPELVGGLPWNT